MNKEWGVLQHFHIEADTMKALVASFTIIGIDDATTTHYSVNQEGLHLYKCEGYPDAIRLPFELTTPEETADFVMQWLTKSAVYGESPDTDGSVKKGYQITLHPGRWQEVATITPTWIVYGK